MGFNYLSNTEIEKALVSYLAFIRNQAFKLQSEKIKTAAAKDRFTASAVYAKISSPHYQSSAMDGIAVLASATFGATETTPVELKLNRDFTVIDTGDPVNAPYDSVIMIEEVVKIDSETVRLYSSAVPFQNIRQIGEDISQGEMILPSNTRITPFHQAALLSAGVTEVSVYKKIKAGIIPTGDEIVSPETDPVEGEIIESNSTIFSGMLKDFYCDPVVYPITKDKLHLVKETLKRAVSECDIVLLNAGSSAGRDDHSSAVIKELGVVLFHGLSIKPGKPAILGVIDGKPVIGIPGYPVSGVVVMNQVVKPLIEEWYCNPVKPENTVKGTLSKKIVSSLKYREFIRVRAGYINDKIYITPLQRSAGVITSLTKADGIIEIDENSEGLSAGTEADVKLLRPISDIKNTLLITGSHDPLIDEASDFMRKKHYRTFISSVHVGSLSGIIALKSRETHIAGIHLLDEDDGTYNAGWIKKYIPGEKIILIKAFKRTQGLIVKKGNPLNLKGIESLINPGVRYVNRQRGAGTRILFDYLLNRNKIKPDSVYGYQREEFTHLSTAVQIAMDKADAGLGIYSAAKLYDLDFIPLIEEEYDFAINYDFSNNILFKYFIEITGSPEFKIRLSELGGYNFYNNQEFITIN